METLWLDTETYSDTPIANGAHRYLEKAEILLFSYAVGDGPSRVWDLTDPDDPDWYKHENTVMSMLRDKNVRKVAHNSAFDRNALRHAWGLDIPCEQWDDTMVQALAHSLPPALGLLGQVLKIDDESAKDSDGRRLINLFCKPRAFSCSFTRADYPTAKEYKAARAAAEEAWVGRATRHTHPQDWEKFKEYARLDIDAMRACAHKMPKWNNTERERALWVLDQKINDRGVMVDLDLAAAAIEAVKATQLELADRTAELTDGAVASATQTQLLRALLNERGVALPDMQMATLEARVNDPDLPEALKELIRIRLQASTTSTSKYATLIRSVSSDGRLRGLLQFCGAFRTGRWAGRQWQPQNLPRPTLSQEAIMWGIEALKVGCAALVAPDVMRLASSALRGCIVAPEGRKLCVADLANIEGRVQAWLAGEKWKLRAFRDYDAGIGPDLYKLAYAGSFGVKPEDVTKDQRQVGKVQELALGYEGGVGAFVTFAAGYNLDLEQMANDAEKAIPAAIWGQASIMLKWHRDRGRNPPKDFGMTDKTWLVCESFVLGWRSSHMHIRGFWHQLRDTVQMAIRTPNRTFQCGVLKLRRDGGWLRIQLPSGRALCYPSPAVSEGGEECPHCHGEGAVMVDGLALICKDCDGTGRVPGRGGQISYFGINQYTRKWTKLYTYGGKLFENICQAIARDVMAHNMPAVEAAGYENLLTVHDELITETPDSPEFSGENLASILATNPPWALDMPLAAEGFEAYRYKKD